MPKKSKYQGVCTEKNQKISNADIKGEEILSKENYYLF